MGDNMFHTGPSPARFAYGLAALRALRVRHAPPLPHARFARALADFVGEAVWPLRGRGTWSLTWRLRGARLWAGIAWPWGRRARTTRA
jgi:hypothetical protein